MVVLGVTRSTIGPVVMRQRAEGRKFGVSPDTVAKSDETVATAGVAVTSLLALQEDESGRQNDRGARQHGHEVVDELTALQHSLLGGDGHDLDQLARLAASPVTAADPVLAGVLRAVRLRAAIELARRGRAASM